MTNVMYIIVNNDLKMGKGKIAAQCCHAACQIVKILENRKNSDTIYSQWNTFGQAKIVLKATEEQLMNILSEFSHKKPNNEIWCISIRDMGLTQIPENSLTVIAFRPIDKKNTPDIIKQLKLL